MLHIQISYLSINLLQAEPNYQALTEPQAETYRLLWAVASVKGDKPNRVSLRTLLDLLQLSSIEPLYVRLENLQRKGLLVLQPEALTA